MNLNQLDYAQLRVLLLELLLNYSESYIPILKSGSKLIPKRKHGDKIHIKKKNRGKFTQAANKAGLSVQEHAASVLRDPNATPLQKKRANFARNAAKWNK